MLVNINYTYNCNYTESYIYIIDYNNFINLTELSNRALKYINQYDSKFVLNDYLNYIKTEKITKNLGDSIYIVSLESLPYNSYNEQRMVVYTQAQDSSIDSLFDIRIFNKNVETYGKKMWDSRGINILLTGSIYGMYEGSFDFSAPLNIIITPY